MQVRLMDKFAQCIPQSTHLLFFMLRFIAFLLQTGSTNEFVIRLPHRVRIGDWQGLVYIGQTGVLGELAIRGTFGELG